MSSDFIDSNLKKIFQEDVDRELPDRFTDLIERLRAGDGKKSAASEEEPK